MFHLDLDLIAQSLEFQRMRYDQAEFVSYELKQKALAHVAFVKAKIKKLSSESLLTNDELELILQCLQATKSNFENYEQYPTYEFKQSQLARVGTAIAQVAELQRSLSNKCSAV